MGKYITKLVNSAFEQAWSSLKAALSESHRGTTVEVDSEDEGEELVPVEPNVWDPCMSKWVTPSSGDVHGTTVPQVFVRG